MCAQSAMTATDTSDHQQYSSLGKARQGSWLRTAVVSGFVVVEVEGAVSSARGKPIIYSGRVACRCQRDDVRVREFIDGFRWGIFIAPRMIGHDTLQNRAHSSHTCLAAQHVGTFAWQHGESGVAGSQHHMISPQRSRLAVAV